MTINFHDRRPLDLKNVELKMNMGDLIEEGRRIGKERAKRAAEYKGPPLRFTFLGNDREADMPWLSHEEAAGTVRMLMRDQLDHEQVCTMARDRILHLAQENARLRAYAEHMQERYRAYRDHNGTEGTYPHPKSVELLEVALGPTETKSGA